MPLDLPPNSGYQDIHDYKAQQIQDLLKKIGMLESSGGVNTNHPVIKSGEQAGDAALGTYGLMPNTMKEMANRYPSETTKGQSKEDLTINALVDPKFANTMAGTMADYLKNKRGLTDEEAAVAWEQGHNTPEDQLNMDSDRARKFRSLNGLK